MATHVLTLLASCAEESVTSESIAGSVNTNPVVIRRLLALLRQAGMVESRGGVGGGWTLLKRGKQITLADVLLAVDAESSAFEQHKAHPNPKCPVGKRIQPALGRIYGSVQRGILKQLAKTTIADVCREIDVPSR